MGSRLSNEVLIVHYSQFLIGYEKRSNEVKNGVLMLISLA